jgi:superfamily II DNA or RNA helicase
MSCLLRLSDIPYEKRILLNDNLSVQAEAKASFNPKTRKMERRHTGKRVDAFRFCTQNGEERVALPFSFCYHHLSNVSCCKTIEPEEKSSRLSFSGNLLQRQKDIREATFEILNRTKSIVLCLHTGFGKTIYALYILSKIGLRTLILCHRTIIMDQWEAAIKKYLPEAVLGEDICVLNVINVPKLDKVRLNRFRTLIVDEVHTLCTEKFSQSLTMLFPEYLIGLSATPFRSDGMDRLLELYLGPEIVYRPMKRTFNAYKLTTGFVPKVEYQTDGKINWNAVLESQAKDDKRNKLIACLTQWFKNRTILILVKRKDHALAIKRLIQEDDVCVFMGTKNAVDYSCRILIATYSKGGVGFDHPGLDMLITGADVEENFMQYLGRVFRRDDTSPIYVDLIDDNTVLKRHAKARKDVVEEVGGTMNDFWKSFYFLRQP